MYQEGQKSTFSFFPDQVQIYAQNEHFPLFAAVYSEKLFT